MKRDDWQLKLYIELHIAGRAENKFFFLALPQLYQTSSCCSNVVASMSLKLLYFTLVIITYGYWGPRLWRWCWSEFDPWATGSFDKPAAAAQEEDLADMLVHHSSRWRNFNFTKPNWQTNNTDNIQIQLTCVHTLMVYNFMVLVFRVSNILHILLLSFHIFFTMFCCCCFCCCCCPHPYSYMCISM